MKQFTAQGVAAATGIAIGPAYVYQPSIPEISKGPVSDAAAERRRLIEAVKSVDSRLAQLEETTRTQVSEEAAEVFAAHRMFLEDPALSGRAVELITSDSSSAEHAVTLVTSELADEFASIGDDYFAQRAVDILDIGQQLVRELMGLGSSGLAEIDVPSIIVADDLTPSDTMSLPEGMALGFCTREGSPTSHAAILARAMGIPAIVGVSRIDVVSGTHIAIDGDEGVLYVNPGGEVLSKLVDRKEQLAVALSDAASRAGERAVTIDGRALEVVANIGVPADAERARSAGAEGVGLLRTEFLFIDRHALPTEDEQYAAYSSVLEVFGDLPVVVRTIDVGGDKQVPGIEVEEEANPFLGKRGIRLALAEPEIFQTQLRALLRAGLHGNLKIMFPMVATLAEIKAAKASLEVAASSLDAQGVKRAEGFEVGIMIEVPSAAVISDVLAPHVDFFSIGTNDLTQYTMAIDRTNPTVAALADPLHPSILRLIAKVIEAAHEHGKWVGLCGELAGDPLAAPALLGLGLDEFSMNPPSIGIVKDALRSWSAQGARDVAERCLGAASSVEVRKILAETEPH